MNKKRIFKKMKEEFFQKNKDDKNYNVLIPFLQEQMMLEDYKKKFVQSIDAIFNLNLKRSIIIKDSILLPHVDLKELPKVLVFAKGDKYEEAKEAGADYLGDEDYINKIKQGWLDFDIVISTPDMMKDLSKVAQILGPKGLMPNPKLATVGFEIYQMVKEFKKGRKIFQANKNGVLAFKIGNALMKASDIIENFKYLYQKILAKKPVDFKGEYIKSIYVNGTMTPALRIFIS